MSELVTGRAAERVVDIMIAADKLRNPLTWSATRGKVSIVGVQVLCIMIGVENNVLGLATIEDLLLDKVSRAFGYEPEQVREGLKRDPYLTMTENDKYILNPDNQRFDERYA